MAGYTPISGDSIRHGVYHKSASHE